MRPQKRLSLYSFQDSISRMKAKKELYVVDERRVTTKQAMNILGCTRSTLELHVKRGNLIKHHHGSSDRFVFYIEQDVIKLRDLIDETKHKRGHKLSPFVRVDKEHYDGLLLQLANLQQQNQKLLEHQASVEARERQVEATKKENIELKMRLTEATQPVWKKALKSLATKTLESLD